MVRSLIGRARSPPWIDHFADEGCRHGDDDENDEVGGCDDDDDEDDDHINDDDDDDDDEDDDGERVLIVWNEADICSC